MSRSELSLDDAPELGEVKTIVVSPGVDLGGVLQTQVVDPYEVVFRCVTGCL